MVSIKAFKKHGFNKWLPGGNKWVLIRDFANIKLKTYQKRGLIGRTTKYADHLNQIDVNRIRRRRGIRLKALQKQLYRSKNKIVYDK